MSEKEQAIEALRQFAKANGRNWRAKLSALWLSGKDDAGLRLARNIFGPSGIYKIQL
jgi:hypothetical protein